MAAVDVDVAIIGAGVSGISAAYHIQTSTNLSYNIYDSRDEIGGTWSLFTFAGIRSDATMFSYQFPWRPWTGEQAIAEGADIKEYLTDSAHEFGIDKKINFGHSIKAASWSSEEKRWTLTIANQEKEFNVTARFIYCGTSYYNYQKGYVPELPGQEHFEGRMVYPQFWPKDLDYRNKKVVVVGSGATAVSLLPSMIKQIGSGSVTILQRSPSYFLVISRTMPIVNFFRRWFPWPTNRFIRFYGAYLDACRFIFYRTFPQFSRWMLKLHVASHKPSNVPMEPHFDPKYLPWEQRLCFVPDGDFFKALKPNAGGHIVTGTIKTFTKDSIVLTDGTNVPCDIVVQATGLDVQLGGQIALNIDGRSHQVSDSFWYRAHMLSGVPNFVYVMGSFFQTWTVSAETAAESFIKLYNYMNSLGYSSATPVAPAGLQAITDLGVNSGYILRAASKFPKITHQRPWIGTSEWTAQWWDLKFGKPDECMAFT